MNPYQRKNWGVPWDGVIHNTKPENGPDHRQRVAREKKNKRGGEEMDVVVWKTGWARLLKEITKEDGTQHGAMDRGNKAETLQLEAIAKSLRRKLSESNLAMASGREAAKRKDSEIQRT